MIPLKAERLDRAISTVQNMHPPTVTTFGPTLSVGTPVGMGMGRGSKNEGRFGVGGLEVPQVPIGVFLYVNAGKKGDAKFRVKRS